MKKIYLLVLVFSLYFLSCNGNDSKQSGSSQSTETKLEHACELLTPAEIESVTGEPMDAGTLRGPGFCQYKSSAKDEYGTPKSSLILRLQYGNESAKEALDTYIANMKTGLGEDAGSYNPTPVAGVGEAAIWESFMHVSSLVAAKTVGNKVALLIIQPSDVNPDKALEIAKALAKPALARL